MPQVVSANRLSDGIVVFLDAAGQWVERLDKALVVSGQEDTKTALDRAADDVRHCRIVDVAAFDVEITPRGPRAKTLRDQIRAEGPTVHKDHGKQAAVG